MHIVISWDIMTAKPAWDDIDAKLRAGLEGYSWVRPLTTLYVVRISAERDRIAIRDRLNAIARAALPVTVHIVVSPAMTGGRYDGFLPQDSWTQLNQRSDP